MPTLFSALGVALIIAFAYLLSTNRRAIRLRVVGAAFALQAGFAALVLYVPFGRRLLSGAASGVESLLGYAHAGVDFLFGPLAAPDVGGASFAISALPVIIFFASLISILYYLRIMPLVIRWIGGALQKVTGISKVESLCAASNIFVGQSESPLVIRPYLAALTPSQLFCMMSVGLAGVAGTILAAYASMGIRIDYLVAAAFMAAPGGIFMAKMIMPDPLPGEEHPLAYLSADTPPPAGLAAAALNREDLTHQPGVHLEDDAAEQTKAAAAQNDVPVEVPHDEEKPANLIMAAAQGAQTGVKLAVAVGAMVLAFVALIALANGLFGWVASLFGFHDLTVQAVLGYVFAPVFYLLASPDWTQAMHAGGLFGTKIVLNEFVAFIEMGKDPVLNQRTVAVVTFALCGFANFSSIAIQLAVTGSLAPNQRPVIAKLGLRALAAGSLSNLMSAALAGLFIGLH